MIRVHNDISCAIDDGRSVLLLLLDLSAAFNTIDHGILLSRLTQKYGFCETVLDWFSSYLSGRSQFVSVNGGSSTKRDLHYGVPQGSVLGPLLFLLYTAPLADVIRKHGMNYDSFQSSVVHETEAAKAKMEVCIQDLYAWMSFNMLKLNTDKTELLVLNAKHRPWPPITSVSVCDDVIMPSLSARNIRVVFDSNLSMETHIDTTCKATLFHLRNLSRICKYLSTKSTKMNEMK